MYLLHDSPATERETAETADWDRYLDALGCERVEECRCIECAGPSDAALNHLILDIAMGDVVDKSTYTRVGPTRWRGMVTNLNADGGNVLLDGVP